MASIQQVMLGYGADAPAVTAALLHMNGTNGSTTFTDDSGKVWTASGGAVISTAQSVFGGASYQNPSAGRIQTPNHTDFDFGTGAFLIEWRQYQTSATSFQNSFSRGYGVAGGIFLQSTNTGNVQKTLYFVDGGGTPKAITNLSTTASNVWIAWAVQRDAAGVVKVFWDGVQTASVGPNADTQLSLACAQPFVIGADNASSWWHRGYIDEFRVQKGVAPYTASGYTPAASPFTYP